MREQEALPSGERISLCERLVDRIETREAVIGIVGLGYVGTPLALRYTEAGFRVIGFDKDPDKIQALNMGNSYIEHISAAAIASARARGLEATTDMARAAEADCLIICVPTPLNASREPDLSYVIETVEALVPHLREGQILSLESTTYPGTTAEELKPRVEGRGLSIGQDFFLVFSPEREDPGNAHFSTRDIPKVCGGDTPACQRAGMALYGAAVDNVVPVSSTRSAELTKLLENIYRSVNIGLINEMKMIADSMDIDIHEVIRAAATKPFGFTVHYPGPGLGGHCIPIDPFYLTWKARQYGVATRFIELAGEINDHMPRWVIDKVATALNREGRPIKDARILILGLSYKKDVDDLRESPSIKIMNMLSDRGATVAYSDPHIPSYTGRGKHAQALESVALTAESIASFDVLVLATNHADFDYQLILDNARLIVDTRGVYSRTHANVVMS
ncbi:UDP-N-acetyl-D-glucosamine dehydrogenase [Massilia sp. WF1]|uniref:nucleotide sugar dehydrogenase n=1 Tax=unclassified Massilia TaxID=2609279 RepID=UPI00064A2345|nr:MULTISPECIES: nucleotide sugar dehydrogenase [unclassified Massilia]ALK97103.1 UDP-N-acetyl-D-glucosamine dehydrogenase [Massilia sp. WG5]KLU36135.1 UDP-N-acetyl-D-glucosamine dehydrogenase [Massilia sp. WF1]